MDERKLLATAKAVDISLDHCRRRLPPELPHSARVSGRNKHVAAGINRLSLIEQAKKSLQLPDGGRARELGDGLHMGRQRPDAAGPNVLAQELHGRVAECTLVSVDD